MSSRSSVLGAFVILATLLALPGSVSSAVATVPQQEELEKRVAELYSTTSGLQSRERLAAQVKFLPPLLRECAERHVVDEDNHVNPDVEVLSWKIKEIQYDSTHLGKNAAYCTGKRYKVEAGASVVIEQRDREAGAEAESGEIVHHWVLVKGTWYCIGVD